MDLISKEDAVALIKAEMDKIRTHSLVDGTARINLRLAKNIIEDMSTIDIVRCKECKWASPNGKNGCALMPFSPNNDRHYMYADDYCSYGERKETEITTDCSWK